MFVFGGVEKDERISNSVEMYSPDANKFVVMAPKKTARCNFACCRVGHFVYLIGWITSFNGNDSYYGETNSIEVYNLDANTWTDGETIPNADSYTLKACAVSNVITE